MMRTLVALLLAFLATSGHARAADENGSVPAGARKVMPASEEAEQAIKSFRPAPGFKVSLFAAEPRVANISSFDLTPDGTAYVVEVFRRRGGGVLDMRNLPSWLDDDLACRSVADRIAMVRRRLTPQDVRAMQIESDRVRRVEDRDGDGKADHDAVFADGFNKLEDGTAAGVLAFNGNFYFANIPSLWLLRDTDGDGKADTRKALATGFGVRFNISGHDLHGLRLGPDGRVYFSIGDRALNVTTGDGRTVSNPDSGAVLRCEPDGSKLELVHTGLRNPQDLAFDEFGNLFTGDNNSDGGDASRWVYVVEGGDSGWRTGYQWHNFPVSRGPWNNERLWDVKSDVPAAYLVPPLANPDVAGPSGLTYTGGVGLPPEWQHRFLLVDFRGGATNSGVWALQNKPKGASFELVETKKLVWGTLATDVECGYDGAVYFSDWVTGWVPMGKGRIYRVFHPDAAKSAEVAESRRLLAAGLARRTPEELASFLGHADMRVRVAAQLELARRGASVALMNVAASNTRRLARLHAIWGLRRSEAVIPPTFWRRLLGDADEEVRAQAARLVGERVDVPLFGDLIALFHDPSDRVKFFAAVAAGRIGNDCTGEAIDLLRTNADRDAYVRHGAVMALCGRDNVPALLKAADDLSPAVRTGIVLALRRSGRPEVARFLSDPEPRVVLEAARGINDAPIEAAAPDLAKLASEGARLGEGKVKDLILMRALNANFRTGDAASAALLSRFAQRPDVSDVLRVEALRMLGDWAKPATRDRITGVFHPTRARDQAVANDALRPALPDLLRAAPDAVRVAAAGLVRTVGLTDTSVLLELVRGNHFSGEARAAALDALAEQNAPALPAAVDAALGEKDPLLRRAAVRAMATLRDGPARLRAVLDSGRGRDLQAAFGALPALPQDARLELLVVSLDRLLQGKVPAEARLDLTVVAESQASAPSVAERLRQYREAMRKDEPLGPFRDCLAGGDASRGRQIFAERADVQCLRCHSVKGEGGSAGPDLAGIGKKQPREYLLESVLFPAKHVAAGWETVTVRLKGGDTLAGVLKAEDAKQLVLLDPEKGEVRVNKADVTARRGGQTAMPDDVAKPLTPLELRDLVEYLASLK